MSNRPPRCRIVPEPNDQVAFVGHQTDYVRWHFGSSYPRPFFYPFRAEPAVSLTRMGHPGDWGHDHHRSLWFGHEKVSGVNFWTDQTSARIRQLEWLAYQSGDEEAQMAVRLGWFDGHDPKELLTQDLIAAVTPPVQNGSPDVFLELQATFTPTAETLEFGQTNFGILGVRVAESISIHFGGGQLTGADGRTGERENFGQPNRWMDYSGPSETTPDGGTRWHGITLYDHPSNPRHPAKWHVREDGWMGPSLCRDAPLATSRDNPLVLRYLLQAHAGPVESSKAEQVFQSFSDRPAFIIERSRRPHRKYEVRRA